MESKAEEFICRSLRRIFEMVPNGSNVKDFKRFQDVLEGLEYYIQEVIEILIRVGFMKAYLLFCRFTHERPESDISNSTVCFTETPSRNSSPFT